MRGRGHGLDLWRTANGPPGRALPCIGLEAARSGWRTTAAGASGGLPHQRWQGWPQGRAARSIPMTGCELVPGATLCRKRGGARLRTPSANQSPRPHFLADLVGPAAGNLWLVSDRSPGGVSRLRADPALPAAPRATAGASGPLLADSPAWPNRPCCSHGSDRQSRRVLNRCAGQPPWGPHVWCSWRFSPSARAGGCIGASRQAWAGGCVMALACWKLG